MQDQIDQKDRELNKLRKELQNKNLGQIIQESDMATVYFTSSDQRVNFAIPCIKTSVFAEVEEKLYKEYPEYRETNNIFIANGQQILRFKTIGENKIGNGKAVMLMVPDNNE